MVRRWPRGLVRLRRRRLESAVEILNLATDPEAQHTDDQRRIGELEAAIEKMCEWNCGLGYAAGECGALGCPIHPYRRAE